MKKMMMRIAFLLLASFIIFVCFYFKAISYGINQGIGQVKIVWNAKPIKELIANKTVADSVVKRFLFIGEVREFAEKELGLSSSENYTTYYDQKGKPILWTVTASPEFEIKAYQWSFPIAGSFPYKGFFDYEKAKKEEQLLREQGFDTKINQISAWSTLGWFKDPILSSMLARSDGKLAELIIHELTHATIYVKDNVTFNENLASLVGKKGAELFLMQKFGANSEAYSNYKKSFFRGKLFRKIMHQSKLKLDSLYQTFSSESSKETKLALKEEAINQIKNNLLQTNYYLDKERGKVILEKANFNNAYFSGFSTYSEKQDEMQNILTNQFSDELKQLIQYYKKHYSVE